MTISPDGVINIQNEGPVNIAGLTNNVTIGANSMVIKDIPDNCMVGGNPTRDHLATTFEVREDVRDYCFHLFWNKPLFGIGQGNFKVIRDCREML